MHNLLADARFAVRVLAKDRRFTLAAVVALGLAIGLNTSVFAVVNAALLRDLPFDEADRLVAIQLRDTRGTTVAASYADFRDWREQASSFDGLAANVNGVMNLSDDIAAPVRLRGSYLSAGTFRLLRTAPLLGRDFLPEDEQIGAAVLMLGYNVWQSRYAGDPSIVGRIVRINDMPTTVIGVMPRGFKYPFIDEVWQSISSAPNIANAGRDARNVGVIGRLKPSVDLPRARTELEGILSRLAAAYSSTNQGLALSARPLRELYPVPTGMLATMMGAVGFVLLIAYANIANLLLARSTRRSQEMAVRIAVGATRWQIIRQTLVECLLIGLLGGALGFALSLYGVNEIAVGFDIIEPGAASGTTRPYWIDVSPNTVLYGFLGLLCIGSALAFGILPAWQMSRTDVNEVLKEDGRGGGVFRGKRWSSVLVTAELALTLVLLTGAGLLWRGFLDRYREDTVINTAGVVTMRLGLPVQKYATPAARKQFLEQLNERLASLTVFSAVTMASHVPMEFGAPTRELFIEAAPVTPAQRPPQVSYMLTGTAYFETLGIPIVRGRALRPGDERPGEEGAVIDERFASQFFSNVDPIGQRIRLGASGVPLTIVGVARTVPQSGPPPAIRPVVYAVLQAEPAPDGRAAIIAKGPLSAVSATLREEVRAMDPTLPLFAIETLDAALARGRFPTRLISTWFGVLALVALVLAAVGVFAITAHNVAQRTHEIGVRMALGAEAGAVVRLFVRRTLIQLAIAIVVGLAGTFAVGRLVQSAVPDAADPDPVTFAIVTALLAIVSLTATFLPARRAATVDPLIALRAQ